MELIKKVWNKIKNPYGIWYALFCVFCFAVITGTLVLVICQQNQTILHYFLYAISAICLTYFVYSIVVLAPKIKNRILQILQKYKFTQNLLNNYGYRTIIFSIFSFIINVAYVVLIGVFGILTSSAWYISITIYYLVLSLVKGNVFWQKKKDGDDIIKQAKAYRFSGIMFIILTIAFSGIIVLIYTSNMYFEYAGLMIYVFATFTFYKFTLAIINIFKAKKHKDLYIQSIRNINLANGAISIVVLQVALFQAFSPEYNTSFANGLTGAGASLVILAFGIVMIIKANKILNEKKRGLTNEK